MENGKRLLPLGTVFRHFGRKFTLRTVNDLHHPVAGQTEKPSITGTYQGVANFLPKFPRKRKKTIKPHQRDEFLLKEESAADSFPHQGQAKHLGAQQDLENPAGRQTKKMSAIDKKTDFLAHPMLQKKVSA